MALVLFVAIAIQLWTISCENEIVTDNFLPSLEVSVYYVEQHSVVIDWHSKTVRSENLASCDLIYSPANEVEQLQVLSNFLPESHTFRLPGLRFNVTYNFHMICHSKTGIKHESNILNFTTGSTVISPNYINIFSSNSYKSSSKPIARDTEDENNNRTVQSSSVILGAVCGIVGFLIINITVVMVVRQYSHYQMRRRRILDIEERNYDEFPYLQRLE